MPTECAHATCKNVVGKGNGLSFHRFPNDKDRAARWTYLMRRNKEWKPKSFDRVCSVHFKHEDFDLTGQTVRLRDGVEPSVFDLPPHLQKASRPRHTKNSQKRPASPEVCGQASTTSSTGAVASISQNFHSYAAADEVSFKDKWLQAERRADDLEQKLHNAVKREKRSRTNIGSLIEELKEHGHLIRDLQQQLEAYKG
ncbi:THAP domain-containing protein 2-like [Thalassophryne amazonica]|uniref:THAP domain-containing protein 2-like n=1 Tax=Thalassophryne amazonica TaxID=390379 RepID=UPI001471BD1C|nr:THAP domain-containing protein 2-like [Thalassophryne amazonica]